MEKPSSNIDKEELKKRLTPQQWNVTQNADTDKPFSHEYDKKFDKGEYQCIVCFVKLFNSDQKFDSACGWPAFFDGLKENIIEKEDTSFGRIRTEVLCKNCHAHLGHVFNDGPKPTGIRYCINGSSVHFVPAEKK
ncbi:Mss4-like protein [Pseudocohnilembus persalinus]|uniref:Peptide-methionine (R)-S-oxide reductase n=1 Tax=Pseudocohnilembus persalinus TaxID=266149 RepID=A0A0V0QH04_PSEPJ|nr:Mss4-like protein [Pseudocohnilembus persalinus]|eukprot:KRX01392.1 Mss4-like protein [Pseudocohnilembus persalinus]